MRGFFEEAVAWDRWRLRAGDYLVEIGDDQKPLHEERWEGLETSYYDIPKGAWKALTEGDDAAGQSIEQAAGSWREQAKAQRDSG